MHIQSTRGFSCRNKRSFFASLGMLEIFCNNNYFNKNWHDFHAVSVNTKNCIGLISLGEIWTPLKNRLMLSWDLVDNRFIQISDPVTPSANMIDTRDNIFGNDILNLLLEQYWHIIFSCCKVWRIASSYKHRILL